MGMPAGHYHTAAAVQAMPCDGNKYEVVHGELLVTPSPRPLHQLVVFRLVEAVGAYLRRFPIGVGFSGGDISWSEDTLVIPDLLVADPAEARTMSWASVKTLLLVVEVLSPGTVRQDRFAKRRLYQEAGVPLYWLVDADAKVVEVWTPDARFPTTEQFAVCWHPSGAAEGMVVQLEDLFRAP